MNLAQQMDAIRADAVNAFCSATVEVPNKVRVFTRGRSMNAHYTVSADALVIETINIAPRYRGRGLGMKIIEEVCAKRTVMISEIINDQFYDALIRRGFVPAGDNERDLIKRKELLLIPGLEQLG